MTGTVDVDLDSLRAFCAQLQAGSAHLGAGTAALETLAEAAERAESALRRELGGIRQDLDALQADVEGSEKTVHRELEELAAAAGQAADRVAEMGSHADQEEDRFSLLLAEETRAVAAARADLASNGFEPTNQALAAAEQRLDTLTTEADAALGAFAQTVDAETDTLRQHQEHARDVVHAVEQELWRARIGLGEVHQGAVEIGVGLVSEMQKAVESVSADLDAAHQALRSAESALVGDVRRAMGEQGQGLAGAVDRVLTQGATAAEDAVGRLEQAESEMRQVCTDFATLEGRLGWLRAGVTAVARADAQFDEIQRIVAALKVDQP